MGIVCSSAGSGGFSNEDNNEERNVVRGRPNHRARAGASEIHVGPYSELERTYTPLMKHIEDQKLSVTEWMYEVYLNSPEETPEAELQTEVCFPPKS